MTPAQYVAVVFRLIEPGRGFERGESVALPGECSKTEALQKLFAALRLDSSLIGGTIRRV